MTRPPRCLAFFAFASSVFAAGAPENVMIVVNGDSWASTRIANEYAALRGIAPNHFIVVHDLPSFERMNVEDFRTKILLPALQATEKRGLAPQADYLLYSADFPTAIDVRTDIGNRQFPPQITQPASITGLTYLYQFTIAKNTSYLGLNTNFYFRQVAQSAPVTPLPDADQARYSQTLQSFQDLSRKLEERRKNLPKDQPFAYSPDERTALTEMLAVFRSLKQTHPKHTELLYNLACAEARLGNLDAAVASLREAMQNGWWDMRTARQDPDLRELWGRTDFKELAARALETKFELWPTSGFRGSVGWQPTGQPVLPNRGMRYLLSTSLAYTSGRGTSVGEAIDGLARSVRADASRPPGTVYFLQNEDIRSTTREWGFRRATEKLEALGVRARIEKGVLPQDKEDVIGLTTGSAGFSWPESRSTILPGAICEHLTSCGGMLHEGDPQTPLTEFLRHGAALASGTVHEPYAIQAKFPTPFLHYHYAQGCTGAEAFYQSIAGPYQLLIVGDALAAPWKKRILVKTPDLAEGMTLRGTLSFTPQATSPDDIKVTHYELHVDGRRLAIAKSGEALKLDTTPLPDGAHQLSVLAIGGDSLASVGRTTISCVIRNTAATISVTPAIKGSVPWDRPIELEAETPGAKKIVLRHLGRDVGAIDGAKGKLTLDPRVLGQGPVSVQPVAILEGNRELAGEPLRFRVDPPTPLPSIALPSGQKLAEGFTVTSGDGAPAVVAKAENDWLAKAGVQPDKDFAVEGWWTVDATDVYQFQMRGPSNLRISVDGKPIDWPRGKGWWFVPVALEKGLHRVRIEGRTEGDPELDIRFGGPGSSRLNGQRFQRTVPQE